MRTWKVQLLEDVLVMELLLIVCWEVMQTPASGLQGQAKDWNVRLETCAVLVSKVTGLLPTVTLMPCPAREGKAPMAALAASRWS